MTSDATVTANDRGASAELARLLNAQLCPAGLPIVTAEMLVNRDVLRIMREIGPIHHVNMGGRETGWLITRHAQAAEALVDPALMGEPPQAWAARAKSPKGRQEELLDEEDLFFLPNDQHVRIRRLITRQLTLRRVTELSVRIQHVVDELLDALPRSSPVDFRSGFARPLPVAVLCEMLGVPEAERKYIRDYVYGWIAGAGEASTVTISAGLAMAEYLKTLISERRAAPQDDLISAMVHFANSDTADQDVLSAVRLLLVAGHRPVTRLLNVGLRVLLRQRDRWQLLVNDPTQVAAVVEELLRIVTPTSLSSRYLKEDAEVAGVRLPAGSGVHCALGAANHDPTCFANPDEFDPHRASNPHLAFGLGRKHCPGAALARVQAQVAFGTLARRFPNIQLADSPAGAGRLHQTVVLDPTGG